VQFQYAGATPNLVTGISSGGRSWTYVYGDLKGNPGTKVLRTVSRPDGSTWQFALDDLARPYYTNTNSYAGIDCVLSTTQYDKMSFSGTLTSPYGLTATYQISRIYNGVADAHYTYSPCFFSTALQNKTYSGPGVPSETWTYSYNNPAGWSDLVTGTGATSKTLTMTNPDGSRIVEEIDTHRTYSEGSILREQFIAPDGSNLRTTINNYAPGHFFGLSPTGGTQDIYLSQGTTNSAYTKANLISRDVIYNGGTTYHTDWSQFDDFDMPRQISETSGSSSRVMTMTYYNDLNNWIVSRPQAMSINGIEAMRMNYGSHGEILNAYQFSKLKMSMTYDVAGQALTATDALGQVTRFSDYYRGIARTTLRPDQTTVSMGVNDFAEITSMTDPLGATVSIGRDGLGRISSMSYPTGDTVAWAAEAMTYTQLTVTELGIPIGSWRGRKTVGNHQQTMYFDAELRPVLIEDKDNTTGASIYQRMRYDYADRMVFSSYKSADLNISAGTNITYDALGRMIGMQTTDGTVLQSIAYLSGNRVQVTDGTGTVTTTTYQAFGEPNMDRPILIAAPEGQTTQIVRDGFGKILSATQGTITQTWVYDSYQRLCKKVEPETGQTVMAYDVADRVIWSAKGVTGDPRICGNDTAPANAVTMTYDAMNRPIRAHYPDTTGDVTMAYDAAGRVISAINPTAAWSYAYNKRGLQENAQVSIDGRSYSIGRRYNTLGDLATQIFPDGLRADLYADAFGRPTQLGGYATGIQYHPNGVISSYSAANGTSYSATLNARQLPETISVRGTAGLLQSLTYGYNAANDVTWILDGIDGTDTVNNLTYDGLHRLKSANGLWGSYSYNYDVLNNLTARSGTNPQSYNYDASNRLASIIFSGTAPAPLPTGGGTTTTSPEPPILKPGGSCSITTGVCTQGTTTSTTFTYRYDAQGRTVYDGLRNYTWNIADELTGITGIATYAYDALGKRIKSTKADGTVEYAIYDGETLVYTDRPGSNQHWSYLKLGGNPFVEVQNGVATYLHADLLGSPRLATTSSGAINWREHYDPYGQKLNGVADKIGYTGHAYDSDSRLTYAQARYLDSVSGRFLICDPKGFDGSNIFSFNRYAYGNNNPYRYQDPDGRATVYRYTNKIVIVQTFKNNGTPFTNDQIKTQGSALGGQTSSGKTVEVRLVPGNDKDAIQFNLNPKLNDQSLNGKDRSHVADGIGGRIVEIAPNAAGIETLGHETGHVLGAGDQYATGLAADGKTRLSVDVPGPTNLMRDALQGPNTQTIDEIYTGANSKRNTQVDCTTQVHAGC